MAAAWNGHAADDGASNLWRCSSGGLRVTAVVPRRRAGRHQQCKHNGRNNGCDCFHRDPHCMAMPATSLLSDKFPPAQWVQCILYSYRELSFANMEATKFICWRPLWVKSRHSRRKKSCPLYPQQRTFAVQLGMSAMGQFCCISPLRSFLVSDSVAVRRFATGAGYDGAADSRPGTVFLFISSR